MMKKKQPEEEVLKEMGFVMIDQKAYVEDLKRKLKALGWSKERLADEAGLSPTIIKRCFNLQVFMSMRTSHKIYVALMNA